MEAEAEQIRRNTRLCQRLAVGTNDLAVVPMPKDVGSEIIARLSLWEHPDPRIRSRRCLSLKQDGSVACEPCDSDSPSWVREEYNGEDAPKTPRARLMRAQGPVLAELRPLVECDEDADSAIASAGELVWDSGCPSKIGGFVARELDPKGLLEPCLVAFQLSGTDHIHDILPGHACVPPPGKDGMPVGWVILSDDDGISFKGHCVMDKHNVGCDDRCL